MMRTKLPLFILLWVSISVNAQPTYSFFHDSGVKAAGGELNDQLRDGNNFIICGKFFDNFKFNPAVTKIDSVGKIIWTTSDFDYTDYKVGYNLDQSVLDIEMGDDSAIYAIVTLINPSDDHERWCYKIDRINGHILWKSLIEGPVDYLSGLCFVENYDSASIAVSYYPYWGPWQKFLFLNRESGVITFEKEINQFSLIFNYKYKNLAFDENKDIYYSAYDSLFKVSKSNPDSIIWKTRIQNPDVGLPEDQRKIRDAQYLYFDNDGELFLLGTHALSSDNGYITKIDPSNGAMLWFNEVVGEYMVGDFIDDELNIYVSWQHSMVGGIYQAYKVTKYQKSNGTELWLTAYDLGEDIEVTCNGPEAGLGLAIDAGRLYITGYFGADNWQPGNWGNLRLSCSTGNVNYETDIDNDYSTCDEHGVGYDIFIEGDLAYYIGQLDTITELASTRETPYLVKTNKSDGAIIEKYPLGGNHNFPSFAIDIQKVNGKIYVLKQEGLVCRIELYDSLKNIQAEKILKCSYELLGDKLCVASDSTFWVTGHSKAATDYYPYIESITDSICLFHFDLNGNLIERGGFLAGTEDQFPFDLICDNDTAYLFYRTLTSLYVIRFASGVFSTPIHIGPAYGTNHKLYFNRKCAYNADNEKFYYATYSAVSDMAFLKEFDKSSFTLTTTDTLPGIYAAHSIQKLNDSLIIISGFDTPPVGYPVYPDVILFNLIAKDTIWRMRTEEFETSIRTSVLDNAHEFIYSGGISLDDNYYLFKIRVSDGMIIWVREYEEPIIPAISRDFLFFDLDFDRFNNTILLTGAIDTMTVEDDGCNMFVKIIDTTGATISEMQLTPPQIGWYGGLCIKSFDDGSFWAGGASDPINFENSGVIVGFDTIYTYPVIVDTIISDSCYALFEYEIDDAGLVHFTNMSFGSDSSTILTYAWDFCDGFISVSEDAEHIYAGDTICACLTISDTVGCSDTYCILDALTDINDENILLNIYPNPFYDNTFIIESGQKISSVEIFDMTGNEINFNINETVGGMKINLTESSGGIYYIRIKAGDFQLVKKLIAINN